MQHRIDPKTGNKLPALGFGCMRLPGALGRIDIARSEALFLKAIHQGLNYFDTAYIYPGSEAALGEIFERNNLRGRVYIATKLPVAQCRSYEDFDKFFDIQRSRLKTDYIDYYFMHSLSGPAQWKRLCEMGIEGWIAGKKASGQVRQLGFSFHGGRDDFLELLELYDWDFCQIQYNYMNTHYQAGVDGLKRAAEKGMPVFIMEPLLGGRLATGLPKAAEKLLQNAGLTPAALALRWLWDQPEVTVVLSGMNTLAQLTENLELADNAAPGCLSEAEQKLTQQVVDIFKLSYKIPCTGCNYCMPCPQGINIPGCFSAYNASYSISRFTGIQQYTLSTHANTKNPHGASDCIACGKCEKRCPQMIAVSEGMKAVEKRMEPFWYKIGMKAAPYAMKISSKSGGK